ncbi:hypothetical protein LCGC14_1343840 [marine sediment metagenome]|uniref:Uncharacterized protein n=1 Tax=marine sediment metagenome TaxID=412755 RepID=A0A0F9KCW2_9ZZZZ
MQKRVLVADDESTIRETLANVLSEAGYKVTTAADGLQALEVMSKTDIDVALLDVRMPEMDGMEVLARIRQTYPTIQVIIITAFGTVESAVQAVKLGASDYVTKPFVFDDILIKIERLLDMRDLADDKRFLLSELESRHRFDGIIGTSAALQEVLGMVRRLAQTRSSALISGESGTGKELIARAIHYSGITKEGRFVAINCSALPESLAESELFGHKRGAFTGAARDKPGLFTLGDGGTVFLDEIGSTPLSIQAKLLRAIEEKQVLPIGSTEAVVVNARILCATNRDLLKEVETGAFRQDLYYRLNVVEVNVPPLRQRREDIPQLAAHFITKYGRELNKPCSGLSNRAMQAMMAYHWPGNVRELENVIERAIIFSDGGPIGESDLAFVPQQAGDPGSWQGDLKAALRAFEKQYILQALHTHDFDKHITARTLNVGLSSLYRKMDQLGITRGDGRYESDRAASPSADAAGAADAGGGGGLLKTNGS